MNRITIAVRTLSALAIAVWMMGCGSDERPAQEAPAVAHESPTPSAPTAAPQGPVNQDRAAQGQQLFQIKGCLGCHTIGGGRLTGPDLEGVSERREFEWVIAMITNPDSMLREDPVAQQLFAEYMTPMLGVGVTSDEAAAIFEFLRSNTQDLRGVHHKCQVSGHHIKRACVFRESQLRGKLVERSDPQPYTGHHPIDEPVHR